MFAPPFSATAGAQQQHTRQRSQSWDPTAGLPPRPHDIDDRQDWQNAMIERPQPMNSISKHPKVKLDVFLNSNAFQAGAAISGTIQVTSATSNNLRLGDIAVELEAFEELTSRDHAATQTFLYNRTLFQGQHLPPSNAVLPSAPHHGYWTARKGRTTFPFSFRLPSTAPSSITFAGNAAVRYVVKATVQAWYQESKTVVATKADAAVVEHWHDEYDAEYAQPVERIGETKLFMGGHGSVWLEASIPHQLYTAGDKAVVRAGIRNASKRDVSGLRIDVIRCLSFPVAGTQQKGPTITQVIHTQHFKGQPFDFASGCEHVLDHLAIDLPSDTRTIRKTRLFEVTLALLVSLPMGSFAKDLQVKLPIYVAHPASVREQHLHRHVQYNYQQPAFAPAIQNQAAIPRSQSAMGQHGIHMPMSPSPSPSPAIMQDHFAIPRSQSAMAQHAPHSLGMAPSPASPAPMNPYNRPHSAAPAPAMISLPSTPLPFAASPVQQSYSPQPAMVQYDAGNNAWNASRFQPIAFPSASEQQPTRSYLAPGPEAQPIPPPQQQEPPPQLEPQPQQPLGLSTIAEDSESRANTVTLKSIRAMGGDRTGVRKSVSKTDVELFEEIVKGNSVDSAQGADSGDSGSGSADKAAPSTGRVNARDVFGVAGEPQQSTAISKLEAATPAVSTDSTARKAPSSSSSAISHPPVPSKTGVVPAAHPEVTKKSTPSATELKSTPAQVEPPLALPSKASKTLSTPSSPARPSSAQGMGLTALEQRLGSTSRGSSPGPVAKSTTSVKPTAASKPSLSSSTSALRLRAAAAEERARKASLEGPAQPASVRQAPKSPLSVAKNLPNTSKASEILKTSSPANLKQSTAVPVSKVSSVPSSRASGADEAVRKVIDPSEARKLGKDAVGRIGGWLDQSNTPPSSQQNVGPANASHIAPTPIHNTPKTPSPSAILQRNTSSASSISPSAALGGGTLRSASTATLTRSPSSNKDISSIASAFGGIKANSAAAPAAKAPLRATSKTLYRDIESGDESSSQDGPSSSAAAKTTPIALGVTRKLTQSFEREAGPASTINSEHDNTPRHDVRSVRGGRGGRVASAASLWASIANGTDGKLPVPSNNSNSATSTNDGSTSTMRRTMVNARPQARRSMNGEAPALDFTDRSKVEVAIREQEEKEQEASARSAALPSHAAPKAVRPKKTTSPKAAIAIPSAFSGHPSNNASKGKSGDASTEPAQPPKITRRAAPPFLNTTTPKVHLSSSASSSNSSSSNSGLSAVASSDSAEEVPAMSGRGTTRAVGKERMAELRNLFAATAAK